MYKNKNNDIALLLGVYAIASTLLVLASHALQGVAMRLISVFSSMALVTLVAIPFIGIAAILRRGVTLRHIFANKEVCLLLFRELAEFAEGDAAFYGQQIRQVLREFSNSICVRWEIFSDHLVLAIAPELGDDDNDNGDDDNDNGDDDNDDNDDNDGDDDNDDNDDNDGDGSPAPNTVGEGLAQYKASRPVATLAEKPVRPVATLAEKPVRPVATLAEKPVRPVSLAEKPVRTEKGVPLQMVLARPPKREETAEELDAREWAKFSLKYRVDRLKEEKKAPRTDEDLQKVLRVLKHLKDLPMYVGKPLEEDLGAVFEDLGLQESRPEGYMQQIKYLLEMPSLEGARNAIEAIAEFLFPEPSDASRLGCPSEFFDDDIKRDLLVGESGKLIGFAAFSKKEKVAEWRLQYGVVIRDKNDNTVSEVLHCPNMKQARKALASTEVVEGFYAELL